MWQATAGSGLRSTAFSTSSIAVSMAWSQSGQGVSRSLAIFVYLRIMSKRWISFLKVAPWWNTLTVSTACLMRSGWPPMVSGCMTSPSTKSMTSAPSGSIW